MSMMGSCGPSPPATRLPQARADAPSQAAPLPGRVGGVGIPAGLPYSGRGADCDGFLESALDWSEYSGLIEVCPESLSPEADACRSHMSLRLNKKPRLEEPGQAKDL